MAAPDLLKLMRNLRAVREYTAEPVSDQTLKDILEVGRWTGTGGNRQPTDIVVVRDPEVKQKMGEWGAKPAANAAVVLLLATNEDAGAMDEGRYAERLMLAAKACGLGSCLATLKNEGPEEVKKLLGIPDDRRARAVVTIGHIDREARKAMPKNPRGGRKPMSEFVHWDRY
ncbi:MAG TPA: nitroreductase family protein [Chloroflexota bacterium]|nr:nitroreductase family protein [Chloroflexota bacterium]